MTLATYNPQDGPHAAAVYFVAVYPVDLETGLGREQTSLHLYFFSEAKTRHGRDLAQNPRAAAAIYPETRDWREIHGLQLRGKVFQVPAGATWEHAWMAYQAKFPFVSALKPIVMQNNLYLFRPDWIRLVDNRQGFGFKQEWNLTDFQERV